MFTRYRKIRAKTPMIQGRRQVRGGRVKVARFWDIDASARWASPQWVDPP